MPVRVIDTNLPDPADERPKRVARWWRVVIGLQDGHYYLRCPSPMPEKVNAAPDPTAVRTALWRALHVQIDPPPHVFVDEEGLRLVTPDDEWRSRPDMSPFTRPFRASIIARARFIVSRCPARIGGSSGRALRQWKDR